MVGGSSELALSALAVDKEIVGRDNEGELTFFVGRFRWGECCCCAAARRAAVAVCGSFFCLGENGLKLDSFVVRGEDARRGNSTFSL